MSLYQERVLKKLVSGASKALNEYTGFTGGRGLEGSKSETVISYLTASNLHDETADSVGISFEIEALFEDIKSGIEFCRKLENSNPSDKRRFDICVWRGNTPIAIVEMKRLNSKNLLIDNDIQRIISFINHFPNFKNHHMLSGYLILYNIYIGIDGNKKEKIINKTTKIYHKIRDNYSTNKLLLSHYIRYAKIKGFNGEKTNKHWPPTAICVLGLRFAMKV